MKFTLEPGEARERTAPSEGAPARMWEEVGASKARAVQGMFASIAPGYDRMNRIMSLGQDVRWRKMAVRLLNLKTGDRAVDLCSGTGDFIPPLRAAVGESGSVLALDFCAPMLFRARNKAGDAASYSLADAMCIPIRSETVDGVSVGWGLRNVARIEDTLAEVYRVLRPGSWFVSIDMAVPRSSWIGVPSRWFLRTALPLLGRLFRVEEAYRYLPESVTRFASRHEMSELMTRAGFTHVSWTDLMLGNVCIHRGLKA